MKFDFFILDQNLCIEYQGQQHYKAIEWFGGEENFIKVQLYDQLKRDYCKKNKISLLEIKYDISLLELPSILDNFLKKDFKKNPGHFLLSDDEEKIEPY